jgi:Holliday junction resolvase RusA-like endonuclease
MPSKAYCEYEAYCLPLLKAVKMHFLGKVKVTAEYTMPDRRSWPDLTGLMQATGDILEKAGIIANDRDIVSWDGTRILDKTSKEKTGVYIMICEETPF